MKQIEKINRIIEGPSFYLSIPNEDEDAIHSDDNNNVLHTTTEDKKQFKQREDVTTFKKPQFLQEQTNSVENLITDVMKEEEEVVIVDDKIPRNKEKQKAYKENLDKFIESNFLPPKRWRAFVRKVTPEKKQEIFAKYISENADKKVSAIDLQNAFNRVFPKLTYDVKLGLFKKILKKIDIESKKKLSKKPELEIDSDNLKQMLLDAMFPRWLDRIHCCKSYGNHKIAKYSIGQDTTEGIKLAELKRSLEKYKTTLEKSIAWKAHWLARYTLFEFFRQIVLWFIDKIIKSSLSKARRIAWLQEELKTTEGKLKSINDFVSSYKIQLVEQNQASPRIGEKNSVNNRLQKNKTPNIFNAVSCPEGPSYERIIKEKNDLNKKEGKNNGAGSEDETEDEKNLLIERKENKKTLNKKEDKNDDGDVLIENGDNFGEENYSDSDSDDEFFFPKPCNDNCVNSNYAQNQTNEELLAEKTEEIKIKEIKERNAENKKTAKKFSEDTKTAEKLLKNTGTNNEEDDFPSEEEEDEDEDENEGLIPKEKNNNFIGDNSEDPEEHSFK